VRDLDIFGSISSNTNLEYLKLLEVLVEVNYHKVIGNDKLDGLKKLMER